MDGVTKKLEVFQEQGDYVIRRVNQFGTAFERRYSESGFVEAIHQYINSGELDQYDIQASDDLWPFVIKILSGN